MRLYAVGTLRPKRLRKNKSDTYCECSGELIVDSYLQLALNRK